MNGYLRVLIVCCMLVALAGCAGRRQAGRSMGPPPPPPPVPPAKPMALDPQLMESARKEIHAALRSNDEITRSNAVEAVQRGIGRDGAEQILAALDDRHPLVQFAATMAVGSLQLNEAHERLLDLVEHEDPMVQIGARFALHRMGNTTFSHDLEKFAVDGSSAIRGTTVMALGMLRETSALKILRYLRRDPDGAVRLQVAEAMWRLGDESALPTLVAASISQYPDDQMLALQALAGPQDRRVMEHVRSKLVTEYDEVALVAARAVGELGSDDGYGVALRGARSADPRQKVLAAMAFGAIGRSDAQPILAEMLKDPNQPVRLAAATALLQLRAW
jgi:HEAT repeat protein